ncbi:MAG: MFS transporter, partial [Candidatus Helarchaeota archaeon]
IILLGLVSLITDASSEIIFPLMPFFLEILGGTAIGTGILIGLIGGLGDSLSSILKAVSGFWSDKIRRKKPFVVAGYSISATSKIFFPLSTNAGHVAIVRVFERTGKGIRDAPRDAIIADSSEEKKGRGFGIHRALDSAGAVIGAIIALLFILFFRPQTGGDELLYVLRITFFFAAGLAFFALIPLIFVKSKPGKVLSKYKVGFKNLPRYYWFLLIIIGLFAFGNFTYMFFVFQTSAFFPAEWKYITPIALYILFNIVYTSLSIPGGNLSDKIGKGNVLIIGYGFFGLTCLAFIFSIALPLFIVGFCLYGVALAFIDSVQRAFISDIVPPELRGTALGTFHMVIGLAALPAGIIAGLFYDINPTITFIYGLTIAIASIVLLTIFLKTNEAIKACNPGVNAQK